MKIEKKLLAVAVIVAAICFCSLAFNNNRSVAQLKASAIDPENVFNVRKFGAQGDGKALDSPAYGFFIRYVKSLTMTDIEISYMKEDARPPFVLDDVQGADFHRVRAQHMPTIPTFVLKNVEGLTTDEKDK